MSKYIKLEDAEKLLTNALRVAQGFDEPLETSLVDLPTIDIVRCRDCKWRGVQNEPEGTCYYWCRNIGVGFAVDEWNYCCWGERIER